MVLKATPVKPAEKQTSRKTNQPAMVIAGLKATPFEPVGKQTSPRW
jgi:hypothetical protein